MKPCQGRSSSVRLFLAAALLAGADLVDSARSSHAADPRRGLALAEEFCARCHVVRRGQQTGEPGVPSFMRMAGDPKLSRESLRQFMTVPHVEMPPPILTREEADDVIAYIFSLRR
jgi:mono/diheme cytochrome c family protein